MRDIRSDTTESLVHLALNEKLSRLPLDLISGTELSAARKSISITHRIHNENIIQVEEKGFISETEAQQNLF